MLQITSHGQKKEKVLLLGILPVGWAPTFPLKAKWLPHIFLPVQAPELEEVFPGRLDCSNH